MANIMRDSRSFPRFGRWVRLIRYTEGNTLRGDQSAPDLDVIGRVTETPHPGFGSRYLTITPALGAVFNVKRQARGEQYTIGPSYITIHANEAWQWTWETAAEPTTRLAAPTFDLAAIIDGMGDLDPRLVRAEIAMRLIRVAAENLAGTPCSGAFRLLEEAKAVLGPATNGITGPGVAYAGEYVERFLDKLSEGVPR